MTIENIKILVGQSKTIQVTVSKTDGTSITESDVREAVWVLCVNQNIRTPLVQKSLGSGITVDSSSRVCITISSADTLNILSGIYYYELAITDSTGQKYVVCQGNATLTKSPALWLLS